mmetsp:Transcript_28920/g.112574  ORF Transcript_28920/g.112574 Transcript_28920/m.112574 type:complete len:227 (+) Transcript_28920:1789-2469(+)
MDVLCIRDVGDTSAAKSFSRQEISSSEARSTLLTTTRSASATCFIKIGSPRCLPACFASTRQINPSSRSPSSSSSSVQKSEATGPGSASPDSSITTKSNFFILTTLESESVSSSFTVQQTHPLGSSTNSVTALLSNPSVTKAPSIPISSAISFSTTKTFIPCSSLKIRRTKVLLPAPRYPLITVTGTSSILPSQTSTTRASQVDSFPRWTKPIFTFPTPIRKNSRR